MVVFRSFYLTYFVNMGQILQLNFKTVISNHLTMHEIIKVILNRIWWHSKRTNLLFLMHPYDMQIKWRGWLWIVQEQLNKSLFSRSFLSFCAFLQYWLSNVVFGKKRFSLNCYESSNILLIFFIKILLWGINLTHIFRVKCLWVMWKVKAKNILIFLSRQRIG